MVPPKRIRSDFLAKALGPPKRPRAVLPHPPTTAYGHSLTGFDARSFSTEKLGLGTTSRRRGLRRFRPSDYSSVFNEHRQHPTPIRFINNRSSGNERGGPRPNKPIFSSASLKKMKMVVPNVVDLLSPDGVGAESHGRRSYGTQEWYFSARRQVPLSKIFLDDFAQVVSRLLGAAGTAGTSAYNADRDGGADAVNPAPKTFHPPTVIATPPKPARRSP